MILKIAYFLVKPVLLALSSTAVCNGRKDDHCQKASTHEELLSFIPKTRRRERFRNETKGVWSRSGQNEALHSLRFSAARTRLLSTSDVSPFTSGWLVVCCAARGLTAVG